MKGTCSPCVDGKHSRCVDMDDYVRDCACNCTGIVDCPTCGNDVVLFVGDDPDDPSFAHGECCTWAWVDSFDGCIRLDLSETVMTTENGEHDE